jgi:hypothetical protein
MKKLDSKKEKLQLSRETIERLTAHEAMAVVAGWLQPSFQKIC